MIDLRSDTVTRPSQPMRAAMASAEVGDDVWRDDPTVIELEESVAELLGKEAGVFVTSGTQGNLCAVLAHCQRGDEAILGEGSHISVFEAGGAAVLGSVAAQTVRVHDNGMIDLEHVESVVKADDPHFARSRLLCVENTNDGRAIGIDDLAASEAVARKHALGHHLDGARLWNAAVALGVAPADIAGPFDTVSVCFSKGLGTPIGSVLVGSADLIKEARKWRKMLGGDLRQVGIVAAAGLYALEHHVDRLADDHEGAARLADGLGSIDGIKVDSCNTNMVWVRLTDDRPNIEAKLLERRIITSWSGGATRLVTHLDVSTADVDTTLETFAEVLA